MSEYQSNTTLPQIAAALGRARHVVVTTHAKPDGDAFGAVIALAQALDLAGRSAQRWIIPPLPQSLEVLNKNNAPIYFHEKETDPLPTGPVDAVVVVDTGSWSQLGPLRKWLEPLRSRTIVLDHHLHGDDVAAMRYVDASAAAVCEIVADLIDQMKQPYDPVIADALYVGLASDTGWFRFSNATPRSHRLAARLLEVGVNHSQLYLELEQSERPQKLLLLTRAMQSLQLLVGAKVALMTLRAEDFAVTGALQEETERFVDIPQLVADVKVVVLLTEVEPGRVRLSFRSKPGAGAVDVNRLAKQFGGGGHARAAGAKVDQPLQAVRDRLIPILNRLPV